MRGHLRYNKITQQFKEEIVEWILSHTNVKPVCVSSDVVTILNPESNQIEFVSKY